MMLANRVGMHQVCWDCSTVCYIEMFPARKTPPWRFKDAGTLVTFEIPELRRWNRHPVYSPILSKSRQRGGNAVCFFSQFCCLDSLFFVEGCRNTFHMRRKGRLIAVLETVDTVDLLVKLQWTCLERWLFYNESSSLRFEMVRIDRIEANIYADLVNLHHILVLFLPNIFKNCFEWVFRPGTWFHD